MKTAESIVDVRRAGPEDAETVLTMVREIAALEGDASDVVSDLPSLDGHARPARGGRAGRPARRPSGRVRVRRPPAAPLARPDILVLDDLYVREGFRDAGVGRLLMRALAALAGRDCWSAGRCARTTSPRSASTAGSAPPCRTKVIAWWRP